MSQLVARSVTYKCATGHTTCDLDIRTVSNESATPRTALLSLKTTSQLGRNHCHLPHPFPGKIAENYLHYAKCYG